MYRYKSKGNTVDLINIFCVCKMQTEYSSEQKLVFAFEVECRIIKIFSHSSIKSSFAAHGFLLVCVDYQPQYLSASRKPEFVPRL